MQTNIMIDDELLSEALEMTGLKTNAEVIELGLKTLVSLKKQEEIKLFRGKLCWEGDSEQMRMET